MNGPEAVSPRPVPEAPPAAPGVSDEDRNRYGALLDSAAERGLLSPTEYQTRLADAADATSVEELQRIVTELPAFGGGPSAVPGGGVPPPELPDVDALLQAGRTRPVARRERGSHWVVLAVVVAVLLVALVALGLVAAHLAHTHGTAGAAAAAARLSPLRP